MTSPRDIDDVVVNIDAFSRAEDDVFPSIDSIFVSADAFFVTAGALDVTTNDGNGISGSTGSLDECTRGGPLFRSSSTSRNVARP